MTLHTKIYEDFNFNDVKIEHEHLSLIIKDELDKAIKHVLFAQVVVSLDEHQKDVLKMLDNDLEYSYHVKDHESLEKLIKMCMRLGITNLNWIDVSLIKDFNGLFEYCTHDVFLKIDKWDVSNATDMESMFANSRVQADLSKWNVSRVLNMKYMFMNSEFNGDISNWDVSSLVTTVCMFFKSKFNGDISKWNVSNVTDMSAMFAESNFNGDISDWDVSSVTNMSNMFLRNINFNCDISRWDVSKVINMEFMFEGTEKFDLDISRWDVSYVRNFRFMFTGSVFNHDLSKWHINSDNEGKAFTQMFRNSKYSYVSIFKNMLEQMILGRINIE